jgi:HK97 family phage major capsid protein
MTEDIRTAVYDLGRAFEQFKEANDQRIKEMERKGSADPLTEMKVNRLNAEISRAIDAADTAKKRVDLLETALSRSATPKADDWAEAETFQLERKHIMGNSFSIEAYRQYKQAFHSYIRKNNAGSGVDEVKALSAGSDPDGGYAVTAAMP